MKLLHLGILFLLVCPSYWAQDQQSENEVTITFSGQLEPEKTVSKGIQVKVTKPNGVAVPGLNVQLENKNPELAELLAKRAITDSMGVANFDVEVKKQTGLLQVVATIEGKTYDSVQHPILYKIKPIEDKSGIILVVEDKLTISSNHPRAVVVYVKGKNGHPKFNVKVVASLQTLTDANLPTTETTTDKTGKATFTIQSGKEVGAFLVKVEAKELSLSASGEGEIIQGYASSFNSKRVVSNLFLGYTVTNNYAPKRDDQNNIQYFTPDGNPVNPDDLIDPLPAGVEPEEGQYQQDIDAFPQYESEGFDRTGFVGALDVDTQWNWKSRKTGEYTGTQIHAGTFLQFAQFPVAFVPDSNQTNSAITAEFSDFSDSFTGKFHFMLLPKSWASYSEDARNVSQDKKFDAIRFGFFIKAGFTTRDLQPGFDNQDNAISRYQAGIRFSHHQTSAASAAEDLENHTPLRFIEVSYEYFEEYAGDLDGANRFVVDAALRLPGIGNDTVPFHAGIHANMGEGPDDVRFFFGFDFKLDKLAALFTK